MLFGTVRVISFSSAMVIVMAWNQRWKVSFETCAAMCSPMASQMVCRLVGNWVCIGFIHGQKRTQMSQSKGSGRGAFSGAPERRKARQQISGKNHINERCWKSVSYNLRNCGTLMDAKYDV